MTERITIGMMIDAIQKHALENYNTDGWDFVVETMDRDDITSHLLEPLTLDRPVATIEEAIAAVGYLVKLLDDRRRDIQATAW
jgi:hypothetical protein